MAGFRRFIRSRAPINSNKHEITWSNLSQNASTLQTVTLVTGVKSADADGATGVEVGNKVRAIYFEFHFSPAQTGNANVIHWHIVGRPTGLTINNPSVYYQDDRSYTFKRGMEMLPTL